MREIKTEGIVLRAQTVGEDDLLADFLTLEEGRVTGIARHGRRSQKRFGTVVEVSNIIHFCGRDRGRRLSIEEASLHTPLPSLRKDLKRLLTAFYLIDIIRESILHHHREPEIYFLLKESLLSLNQGAASWGVVDLFQYRFLELSGYQPRLEHCLSCNKKWEEGFSFVYREGGVFCPTCLPIGPHADSFSERLRPKVLGRFLEYQLGHPLRSRKVLTQLALSE